MIIAQKIVSIYCLQLPFLGLNEFKEIAPLPLLKQLSLESLAHRLAKKTIRFYIGNHDTRVGTRHCFDFIESVTKEAHDQQHRSLPIECIIYPSVGHKGHGTPPHIFEDGAAWIQKNI